MKTLKIRRIINYRSKKLREPQEGQVQVITHLCVFNFTAKVKKRKKNPADKMRNITYRTKMYRITKGVSQKLCKLKDKYQCP